MAIANITGNILTDSGVSTSSLVSGSGTTNYLPKFTGASALGNSVILESTSSIGIGTTPPTTTNFSHLFVGKNISMFSGSSTDIYIGSNFYYDGGFKQRYAEASAMINTNAGDFIFQNSSSGTAGGAFNGVERIRITSAGSVGIGTSSPMSATGTTRTLQLGGSTIIQSVVNNQTIFGDNVYYDGSGWKYATSNNAAAIRIGAATSGEITFHLAASGTAGNAVTNWDGSDIKMRITSGGYLKASNTGTYYSVGGSYHEILQSASSNSCLRVFATSTSYDDAVQQINCYRTNSSAYSMAAFYSNNFADIEFNFRGDGNGYADGSWNGGGADYAEYFEWLDGNPNNQDRRGYCVSLVGNKIKIAEKGEKIIGVISGNPSVIGDSAWNIWAEKYLRDDFGTYVRDENGDRVLNPNYNPDIEYIPREQRPEWAIVGLMGKLCIRKGQEVMPNWIKMKDISDSVEQWLIK